MGLIHNVINVCQKHGLWYLVNAILEHAYAPVREQLPRQAKSYNGVELRAARLGDGLVPWRTGHPNPEEYEYALLAGIRNYVSQGDDVVVVGGGWGVSTVVAASRAGINGTVTVYEGAAEWVDRIRETLSMNNVPANVDVVHAVVGESVQLRGTAAGSKQVVASELPECDILILDCEGAELTILDQLTRQPDHIVVESHGFLGTPSEEIRAKLDYLGYDIVSNDLAEKGSLADYCDRADIRVLVGTLHPIASSSGSDEKIHNGTQRIT